MKIPRDNSLLFPYFSLFLFYFSFPFLFLFPLLTFFPDSCTGRIKHALRDLRTRIATALRGVPGANVAYAESCTRDTRAKGKTERALETRSRINASTRAMRRTTRTEGGKLEWPPLLHKCSSPSPSNRGILMRPSGQFMVTNVVH